jgi:hypothetical protein
MPPADDNVSPALVPALTPQGHLVLAPASAEDAQALPRGLQKFRGGYNG